MSFASAQHVLTPHSRQRALTTHGTPDYYRVQPIPPADVTLGTVPTVGSPLSQLTVSFSSIQGAKRCTHHHPLIACPGSQAAAFPADGVV